MNRLFIFTSVFLISFSNAFPQSHILKDKLAELPDIQITQKENINFKEFYEVIVTQPLDHSQPFGNKFQQRILIGFNDFNAANVMSTDGYGVGYALSPGYTEELSKKTGANLFVVEHRFFGKSVPDKPDWEFLTVKQAADDYHAVKILFDKYFTGKWISTGISKGGQAALAYKLYYPEDVVATVVYGTAVKNKQTIPTDSILSGLSQNAYEKKLVELQLFSFKNKKTLLPLFNDYVSKRGLVFKPLDTETIFDYLLLEMPFS
ncbi:MAG: S28 family serine protease, partial [Bacteroidia bacterium]